LAKSKGWDGGGRRSKHASTVKKSKAKTKPKRKDVVKVDKNGKKQVIVFTDSFYHVAAKHAVKVKRKRKG
jgi:hypothetical protein